MKNYLGKKLVKAEPLNEEEAVEEGLARANSDNHEWREGYLVEYENGYHRSWSPKDVFEKAYHLVETPVDRMAIEEAELEENHAKLLKFITSTTTFTNLDKGTKALLQAQKELMGDYLAVLRLRLAKMKNEKTSGVCGFSFSVAFMLIKNGYAVKRRNWNGKDQFVYYVPSGSYPAQTDVAKDMVADETGMVKYNGYMAIKTVQGPVSTWVPSITDILSNDWELA